MILKRHIKIETIRSVSETQADVSRAACKTYGIK